MGLGPCRIRVAYSYRGSYCEGMMLVVCGLGAWALSMFACSGARRAMGACQGGSGSLLETVGIALGACRKGLGACRDVWELVGM